MDTEKRAFTLIELLSVIAIIAIIAAITFPVMRAAISSSQKTACASNFRQVHLASTLYLTDYDDRFMLVNYKVDPRPDEVDRTWVQLVLPYLQEFDVFRCPSDFRHREKVEATFDIDFMPGDTYGRYYRTSLLSNIGYNYLYLSPVVRRFGQWEIQPKSASTISDPSSMIQYADTISPRTRENEPLGGGSYIVIPPCRFGAEGDDTFEVGKNTPVFAPRMGWLPSGDSPEKYGRAWPWHMGRTNIARVDGSMRSLTMDQLASGCQVQTDWSGTVSDSTNYLWDPK